MEWIRIGKSGMGGGSAVLEFFGGKRGLDVPIFVREDLQNRVDAKDVKTSGPVRVVYTFRSIAGSVLGRYLTPAFKEWTLKLAGEADERSKESEVFRQCFEGSDFPVLLTKHLKTAGLNSSGKHNVCRKGKRDSLESQTKPPSAFSG